jgi:hypothetical protein
MQKFDGKRNKRSPVESIIIGFVLTAVFGGMLFSHGGANWFWAFPMLFAGILPTIDGFRRLSTWKKETQYIAHDAEADGERRILRAAIEEGGRLTAAKAALIADMTMEHAQDILENMTKNGHALMRVTSSGVLEFEFPEFIKDTDNR